MTQSALVPGAGLPAQSQSQKVPEDEPSSHLFSIATITQEKLVNYKGKAGPVEEIIQDAPVARAQPAKITKPKARADPEEEKKQERPQSSRESLEERRLRLEASRNALKK